VLAAALPFQLLVPSAPPRVLAKHGDMTKALQDVGSESIY